MHKLTDLKAGEFIDFENYYKEIIDNNFDNLDKFYLLLLGKDNPIEKEVLDCIELITKELIEIKETYYWLYNPPQMPTESQQQQPTIGDDYRQEFAEDYGGYVEVIYMICKGDILKVPDVMQMKLTDFLYWGEYLLRKKFVENIK